MSKSFHVDILTPDKAVYAGEIISLIAPGELGYLGILANHAPLVTSLVSGKVSFKEASGKQSAIYSKGNGLMEVFENNVTLLLEHVENSATTRF